jgi:hypothetical protein
VVAQKHAGRATAQLEPQHRLDRHGRQLDKVTEANAPFVRSFFDVEF